MKGPGHLVTVLTVELSSKVRPSSAQSWHDRIGGQGIALRGSFVATVVG
jgi:hypothetical protein